MEFHEREQTSSLSCELRIIRAKNIDTRKAAGELFVRCYLSAGNNQRVRLETKDISSKSDLTWNQTFSLDCSGTEGSIECLKQGGIVLELRSKSNTSFIGRMNGSKLLGRAEIPWKHVLESRGMEIERWAVMKPEIGRTHEDVKPPAVQIAITVQESEEETATKRNTIDDSHHGCGCSMNGGYNCCVDYEFFAIGAALEEAAF